MRGASWKLIDVDDQPMVLALAEVICLLKMTGAMRVDVELAIAFPHEGVEPGWMHRHVPGHQRADDLILSQLRGPAMHIEHDRRATIEL